MNNSCCFFGHRKVAITNSLKRRVRKIVERLITKNEITTFFFGSKSNFNDLCYEVVSELKEKYPWIKRVYVRAEFPYINNSYRQYLLESYEETYYPSSAINAGKAVYVKRNLEMINNCSFCVIYFSGDYTLSAGLGLSTRQPKSGTKIAFAYAVKKQRTIINLYNDHY